MKPYHWLQLHFLLNQCSKKVEVTEGPLETKALRQGELSYEYIMPNEVYANTGVSSNLAAIVYSPTPLSASRVRRLSGCITNRLEGCIREIQRAVRLLLPRELALHPVSKGTKAFTQYTILFLYR
ncbi:histone H2B type 1-A-like [Castor canadensis]|uniref:Histone H2B type 1-A-like n=1 Tax=Castor canadensis TaxID=51338 RepID=A0AC58NGX5_CASCN